MYFGKLPLNPNPFGMRCSIVALDRPRRFAVVPGAGDSAAAEWTFDREWPMFDF